MAKVSGYGFDIDVSMKELEQFGKDWNKAFDDMVRRFKDLFK